MYVCISKLNSIIKVNGLSKSKLFYEVNITLLNDQIFIIIISSLRVTSCGVGNLKKKYAKANFPTRT